ncbi:hypothetical protein A6768_19150 [Sphingobium yanoikuyae]|uniref:Uncharacterized protein n=1 Tax=Sphingobium yanoikuyae TaxID=13690 RepID=A0A291N3J5_SPHYA|nr:hypothetical protein A6768_19150 [Sphingobium yanoikuyae]
MWKSHGTKAHGNVVNKVMAPNHIKIHKLSPSRQNREYILKCNKSRRNDRFAILPIDGFKHK